jgi:hypothetical protein
VFGFIGPYAGSKAVEEKPFILVCATDNEVRSTLVYILRRVSYPHGCWAFGEGPMPKMDLYSSLIVLIGPCYSAQEGELILNELKTVHNRIKAIFLRDPFSPGFASLAAEEEVPAHYSRLALPLNLAQFKKMLEFPLTNGPEDFRSNNSGT